MQTTIRAPNLCITFFLILVAIIQPLLAAPVEITTDAKCAGDKERTNEADNFKLHAADIPKSKYTPRSVVDAKKLKKRSQLAAQLKKRAVQTRDSSRK
ncbi:hypothetical protein TWF281_001037 [Arthrobotrys megalospora]